MATEDTQMGDSTGQVSHLTARRNSWSFENRWAAKLHEGENMDFRDDTDNWSLASYDSTCSVDMDTHTSVPGIPRRSSLKDLTKMADSIHNLDHSLSPQSTPGLSRKVANRGNSSKDLSNNDLKEKNRSGLSNSMILNWLCFKKYQQYPTIVEASESPKGSPVDESSMDSAITVLPGPGAANLEPHTVNTSGKLLEAATPFTASVNGMSPPVANTGMKRNFSLNEMGAVQEESAGIKRNFSFKDLNAVAPSYW